MSEQIASLYAKLGVDVSALQKGLGAAEQALGGAGAKMAAAGQNLTGLSAKATSTGQEFVWLADEVALTDKSVNALGAKSVVVGQQINTLGNHAVTAGDKMRGMNMMMAGAGMSMLGLPLLGTAIGAAKLSAEFEQLGNISQVLLGATDAQRQALDKLALKLGKDTVFSAGEAAKGINELAKAGLSIGDIMGAMPGVLALAAAGDIDIARAAEIASNAMNAFGLSGEDMNAVADVLAATANASSVDVNDLADSLKMVASVAGPAGLKVAEVNAVLGIMGNMGMKGSDAGTSLKQMLLSLETPSKQARAVMQQYGIALYDSTGKMKNMREIVGSLQNGMRGLTQEQRDLALGTIFGSDAVRSSNIIVTAGVEGYDKMYASVTKTGGASELANARMKGLAGSIEYLKGSLDTLLISSATPFNDTLSKTIRIVADLVSGIGELPAPLQKALAIAVAGTGGILVAGGSLAVFAASLGMIMPMLAPIGNGLGALGGAIGGTIGKLRGESQVLGDLGKTAKDAADGKKGVTDENQKLTDAAGKAEDGIKKEASALSKLKDLADNIKLPGMTMPETNIQTDALSGVAKGLGGAISGMLIGALGGALAGGGLLTAIGGGLAAVASGILAVVTAPAFLIAAAIIGAIIAGIWAWQNWDSISAWFGEWTGKIGDWLGPMATAVGTFLTTDLPPIVGAALGSLGEFIGEQLGEAGKSLGNLAGIVGDALGELPGVIGKALSVAGDAIKTYFTKTLPYGIAFSLSLAAGLAYYGALKLGKAVLDGIGGLVDAVRGVFTNIGGWIADKILETWNWLAAELPTWPGKVGEFLGGLGTIVGDAFGQARDWAIARLQDLWTWMNGELPTWPGKVGAFLGDMGSRVGSAFDSARVWALGKLADLWAWITAEVPTWPGKVGEFLGDMGNRVGSLFDDARANALKWLGNLWTWVTVNIPTWPRRIGNFLGDLPNIIGNLFGQAKDWALDKLGDLWSWISVELPAWGGYIGGFLGDLPGIMQGIFDEAIRLAGEKLSGFIDTAKGLANDIKEGILSPLREIIAAIKTIFDSIVQGIIDGLQKARDALGIHSPSSVMVEMGKNLTRGFEIGINPDRYSQLLSLGPRTLAMDAGSSRTPYSRPDQSSTPVRQGPLVQFGDVHVRSNEDLEILAYRVARRLQAAQR